MRVPVIAAALLVLRCGAAATETPCAKGALGFEAGATRVLDVLPGGPADAAGLRSGDVVVQIGDERIEYACEAASLARERSCAPVKVIVERDGQTVEATVTPVEQSTLYAKACADGNAAACQHVDNPSPQVLERACNGGSGAACTLLASSTEDETRALELYTRACNLGHARGCYGMGIAYDRGRGAATNNARAAYGYEQACDAGVSMACTDLGFLFERGRGTIADRKRAADLYRRGCEGSPCEPPNLRGCVNLGDAYRDGIGVAQDYARAAQIFRATCDSPSRAEEESRIRACVLFAALQFNGQGVEEDAAAAFRLSSEGCEQGDAFGCYNVAVIHASRGEDELAARFYQRSCDGDDGEACYQLALLYEEAKGVPFDAARATTLRQRACRLGHAPAC